MLSGGTAAKPRAACLGTGYTFPVLLFFMDDEIRDRENVVTQQITGRADADLS